MSEPRSENEPALRRLAAVLLVEGVVLSAVGVGYAVVSRNGQNRSAALLAAAAAVLTGLLLVGLARATSRARGWSRAPAVTVNLFSVPLGLEVIDGGQAAAGAVILALAGTVLYLYATPSLRLVFRER